MESLKNSKMEMMKSGRFWQNVFLIMLFGLANQVSGQQLDTQKEHVSFSIPKTLYFSGEKIWIDATVLLGSNPTTSQVLYAELVDQNSNSIAYAKLPLVQGKSLNFLEIHSSVPSAHYLLRVYTRISPFLDLTLGMAQQLVTVINPALPPAPPNREVRNSPQDLKSDVTFSTSQKNLSLPEPAAQGTVTARGISIANPFLDQEQKQILSADLYAGIEDKVFLPELFGHVVEVKIPDPEPNSTFFLSVHGKQSALFTDIADEQGRLLFDIGGLKHWDRMIIQLENGAEMPGIELVSPVVRTRFKEEFVFPQLVIEKEELPRLEKLLKAAHVETYYKEEYFSDSMEVITGFVADYTYQLDDYVRFDEVETVLKEYVPSVFVRTREKKKEFRLLDQANKQVFESNPLILVDAMPVFDSDLLAAFNPKFMSRLEVLNREFYLNESAYPGVLSWSSYENNFGLFPLAPSARFFDYYGLQPKINLDRTQFGQAPSEDNFPDWRTVLLWDNGGERPDNIQTPDLDGLFVYWVKSTDAQGKVHYRRSYFSIQP